MKKTNKKIAHCIHHTHWDPFWYFTAQDAMVIFSYNVKEMLLALENGEIKDFFMDGQTVAMDEYLENHPEDFDRIKKLVTAGKLIVGPFNSQLDCFITSGESVINNLRLGIESGDKLGGSSKIAYLPDSFGHSYDFPKIFNQYGIYDFVFTRGMCDEYGMNTEFYFKSNDGSKVLCYTLLSGYGYGAYAFKDRTLFTEQAEDYNKINVQELIDRLLDKTSIENEFVFPLGFDQNPIMLNIEENLKYYNEKFSDYHFQYTSWKDFMRHVRLHGKDLKTHNHEILAPQYHRIHISGMHSARSDIKTLQDQTERMLTFEVQPLMSMLDSLGVNYDQGIINRAWYVLASCQTHASATHIDETNAWIKHNSTIAKNIAYGSKIYLTKLLSASVEKSNEDGTDLIVVNTLPHVQDIVSKFDIYTKNKEFVILDNETELEYTIVAQEKLYRGVLRKDPEKKEKDKDLYKTTVILKIESFNGISYRTLKVIEKQNENYKLKENTDNVIENKRYRISVGSEGIDIYDKTLDKLFKNALMIEDMADVGDTYDYSYPEEGKDWVLNHAFNENIKVKGFNSREYSELEIEGFMMVPSNYEKRLEKIRDSKLAYKLQISMREDFDVISIKGTFDNKAKNHRVRLVTPTDIKNDVSYAGTQFGYIKRNTKPLGIDTWRENNWFEEPSSTKPLLNYVASVGDAQAVTLYTRSLKEYDFIDENCSNIAVTIFRSVGYVGLPDLERRPGRPSGMPNKLLETPDAQMIGKIDFDFGIGYSDHFDPNHTYNTYSEFAVDTLYYQNQDYDTTVHPIAIFPINPIKVKVPRKYDFLSLNDFKGSFSTIMKSQHDESYTLRVFNSDYEKVEFGEISSNVLSENVKVIDLLEKEMEVDSKALRYLKAGELRSIKILKK